MPKTETIQLENPDGWWEIKTFIPMGVSKDWMAEMFDCMDMGPKVLEPGAPDSDETEIHIDWSKGKELAAATEAFMLGETASWSYGDVTPEVFQAEVPTHHTEEVAERMAELYRPLVRRSVQSFVRTFFAPSIEKEEFQ